MPVNYGLYNSINTATFASAAQLDFCGIQKVVDAVGIRNGLDGTPVNMHQLGNLLGAIGVSPLNMASAFATFANNGQYCAPRALQAVSAADGSQLPVPEASCREAVKPDVARGMNYVLQDVLKRGSGVYINPKIPSQIPVAAKTGTSNNNGATWVVGYTTGLATASFFGDALEGQQRAGQNVTNGRPGQRHPAGHNPVRSPQSSPSATVPGRRGTKGRGCNKRREGRGASDVAAGFRRP